MVTQQKQEHPVSGMTMAISVLDEPFVSWLETRKERASAVNSKEPCHFPKKTEMGDRATNPWKLIEDAESVADFDHVSGS